MINLVPPDKENAEEFPHKTLRAASLNDIPWIVEEARKEFRDSPYAEFGIHNGKARQILEKLIADGQDKSIVLISHDQGKPVGVLAAYAFEPSFSVNKIAQECLWFLTEEYRKGSRGHDMMKAYEYWARLIGCTHVQYGLLSSSPERMETLYQKTGAVQTERIFMKAL